MAGKRGAHGAVAFGIISRPCCHQVSANLAVPTLATAPAPTQDCMALSLETIKHACSGNGTCALYFSACVPGRLQYSFVEREVYHPYSTLKRLG